MSSKPELLPRRAVTFGLPFLPFLAGPFLARPIPSRQAAAAAGGSKPRALAATVVLLRHAEKSTEGDPKDPSLSEAGARRAKALAALLGKARASRLYASEFKRTQETLAPLAEATKVAVTVDAGAKTVELAGKLLELPAGSVAVVAGHSNTVPALATLLGGTVPGTESTPQGPVLPDAEYGRIFVVTPDGSGKASVLELAY